MAWQWALIVTGIAASLVTIYQGFAKPFMRMVADTARTNRTLTGIADDFSPNNGGSLKDHIARLEAQTAANTNQLRKHDRALVRIDRGQKEILRRLPANGA